MNKIVTILALCLTVVSFSQTKNSVGTDFTIAQIDSIAVKNGRNGIAEGNIKSKKIVVREDKKTVVKGDGQSSISIYMHHAPTFSRLIKSNYHRNIKYRDASTEEVYAQFYYNEKNLFFIILTEIINDGTKTTTKTHEIDVSKMNLLQNSDFLFTTNIQKWIAQLDAEILKLSKNANPNKAGDGN